MEQTNRIPQAAPATPPRFPHDADEHHDPTNASELATHCQHNDAESATRTPKTTWPINSNTAQTDKQVTKQARPSRPECAPVGWERYVASGTSRRSFLDQRHAEGRGSAISAPKAPRGKRFRTRTRRARSSVTAVTVIASIFVFPAPPDTAVSGSVDSMNAARLDKNRWQTLLRRVQSPQAWLSCVSLRSSPLSPAARNIVL